MIPGDIDLTENLDFRKVVKRHVPNLPDVWNPKKNKLNIEEHNYIESIDSINSTSFTYTTSNSNITTRIALSYDDNINMWFDVDIHRDNSTRIYSTSSRTYLSYDDTYTEYDYSTGIVLRSVKSIEPEKDVFGNLKPVESKIPDIPWNRRNISYPSKSNPIAWDKGYSKNHIWSRKGISDIPWDIDEEFDDWEDKEYHNMGSIDKALYLIGWFESRTRSFIKRYLEPVEDVDLSYLTNMSWIRVHDALVD